MQKQALIIFVILVAQFVLLGSVEAKVFYPQSNLKKSESIKNVKAYALKFLSQKNVNLHSSSLKLISTQKSILATHYTYKLVINGYTVESESLIVSVNSKNMVQKVYNTIEKVEVEKLATLVSFDQVKSLAWNVLNADESLTFMPKVELDIRKIRDEHELVYTVSMSVKEPYGHWVVSIRAFDGKVLRVAQQMSPTKEEVITSNKKNKSRMSFIEAQKELQAKLAVKKFSKASKLFNLEQGMAKVFDPNPNTALNSPSIQTSSSDVEFDDAYSEVNLVKLTQENGVYKLANKDIVLSDFDSPSNTVSTSSDGVWDFSRNEKGPFLDTMTYFHLQKSIDYLRSLGFSGAKEIWKRTLKVDSDGARGADNSYYSPASNSLSFGHGCVPDNEDADVILHELGHAIQRNIVGSNWSGGDTGAMGEGFGDYWAASYSYTTPNGRDFNPNWVFKWDGHNSCWGGRQLDRTNMKYSHSKKYGAHQRLSGGVSDELWSTPVFQAFVELYDRGVERSAIDTIVIESHFGLSSGLKMRDMAEVMVKTAEALYPNEDYASVFEKHFKKNKILK